MRRVRWVPGLWILLTLSGLAASPDPAIAPGLQLLQEGRITLQQKPLQQARDSFLQLTQKDPSNAEYFYWLARADAYRCDAFSHSKDKKSAESAIDSAIAETLKSISLRDSFAEAHAMLADLYGRKISFGGFMSGPRYGPKIQAENKKAVALDASSPQVYAALGRQYFFAPKMFGGNIDKAIENFKKATQIDPRNDENFVWLGIAYRTKGDTGNAEQAFREALRLNPHSVFAQESMQGIDSAETK